MTIPPVEPPFGGGDLPQPPQPPPPPPMPPMPPSGQGAGGQKNDSALYSLIAGILSIFCFGFLAGIPAIILGKQGMKKAETMGGEGEGQAKAGFILGIIGTILSLIAIAIWILMAVVFVSSTDSISNSIKESNKEYSQKAERQGEAVNSSDYSISGEDVVVEDYGYVTYKAKITNEGDFKTGYTVTVTCEGSEGDEDSNDVYIGSVRENGTKSIETTFYFDQDTTSAKCSVDEVVYEY